MDKDKILWKPVVITFISITAVTLICIIGWLNHQAFKEKMISQMQNQMLTISKTTARGIEDFIRNIEKDLQIASRIPEIQNIARDRILENQIHEEKYHVFSTLFKKLDKRINAFYLLDADGVVLDRSPIKMERIGSDYSDRPGVDYVLKEHKPFVTGMFETRGGEHVFSVLYPIFKGKEFVGILRAIVSIDRIYKHFIQTVKIDDQGFMFLTGNDGKIYYHPEEKSGNIDEQDTKNINLKLEGLEGVDNLVVDEFSDERQCFAWTYISTNPRPLGAAGIKIKYDELNQVGILKNKAGVIALELDRMILTQENINDRKSLINIVEDLLAEFPDIVELSIHGPKSPDDNTLVYKFSTSSRLVGRPSDPEDIKAIIEDTYNVQFIKQKPGSPYAGKNVMDITMPIHSDEEMWSLIVVQPYDNIAGEINKNMKDIIGFIGLLFLALVMGGIVLFRTHKQMVVLETEKKSLMIISEKTSKIHEQSLLLTNVLDSLPHPFYVIDANDYSIIMANSIAGFGMLDENSKCYTHTHNYSKPCSIKNHQCPLEKVKKTKKPFIVEHIHDKNGEPRVFEVHGYPIFDDQNNVTRIIEYSMDITERKIMVQTLRESEEKFRGVIEQSNDGIYVLQGERFVFINPRFTKITGFEWEEISAEDFDFTGLVAEEGLKVLEDREEMRKRGEELPERYIFKGLRKDGQKRDLEVSITIVEWQGAPATLGVLHDVTERIEARRELEEALQSAKQADSVKSLFMANMSHEIRTPLNAILGFTELIESSTRHLVSEEEQEFFDTIRDNGNRLMETVHEILDISLIEAGTYDLKLEYLDLVILVRNMIRECQSMADKKGLKIEYSSEIDSAFIKADQYSITQAISNIIDNAIKYTEQGEIAILLKQTSKQYVFTIQDTGIGIAEKYMDNLYNAFSQESEGYTKKYQGIGLGMAIAKRHLDLNHVAIDVESTKGVGTTFTLKFEPAKEPIQKKKQVKQIETKGKPTIEAVDKPKVLLVEDDISSQQLTKFFLKEMYDMYFAVSVEEAKQQLKKHSIDLILLDLSLVGNEDGLDLVGWMRKSRKWKKTPVIATTAHAFTTDQNNCLAAGCNDYLPKPIKKENLLDKICKFV